MFFNPQPENSTGFEGGLFHVSSPCVFFARSPVFHVASHWSGRRGRCETRENFALLVGETAQIETQRRAWESCVSSSGNRLFLRGLGHLFAAGRAFIVAALVAAVPALCTAGGAVFRGLHFRVRVLCEHGKCCEGPCDEREFQCRFHGRGFLVG